MLSVSGDHAGLHVLVEADTGCSEREICERAAAQGVKVSGLGEYALTKDGGGGRNHPVLLLGYGSLTEQEIQMGLTRAGFDTGCAGKRMIRKKMIGM